MDISKYLGSDFFKKEVKGYAENAKLETLEKTIENYKLIAGDSFNEGIMSILQKINTPDKRGSLEKSRDITKMLPDIFCKDEMGQTAAKNIIESIKSNQTEGILNIGYEELVKRDIENMIRIIYAIGVTTGFEIASDEDYKAMYLVNKDRFIMHGSTEKPTKETKTKKSAAKE